MNYNDFTEIPPSDFEIRRLFESDDELGVVLKGHLYIEHYLGLRLTQAASMPPDEAFEISFAKKVRRARQEGIIPADEQALYKAINDIRNRFAHQPRSYFSDSDADSVWNALSSRLKDRFANVQRFGPDYFDLPLDLFRCCIVALCGILDGGLQLREKAE